MIWTHVITVPPGSRIFVGRHLECTCILGMDLKEQGTYPHYLLAHGILQDMLNTSPSMAKSGHSTKFPRGTPKKLVLRSNRPAIMTMELRMDKKVVIMILCVETQQVQAISASEGPLIHGRICSHLHSCTLAI
jgi:hypothetical protein